MALDDSISTTQSESSDARQQIADAYEQYLGRSATKAELDWRVSQLPGGGGGNNTSLSQQIMDIAGSSEAAGATAKSDTEEGLSIYEEYMNKALEYQLAAAKLAKEGLVEQAQIAADESKRASESALAYLKTGKEEAQAYYNPYQEVGETGLSNLQSLIEKGVEVTSDITKSPYYSLYSWEKDQQDKSIKQKLAGMGLLKSGYGITKQVQADTGLADSLSSTEYERARQTYLDKLGLAEKMSDYGYSATQGAANASIGAGSSSASTAMQTGSTLSSLASSLGSNLASIDTSTGSAGSSLYSSYGSTAASALNQGALARMGLYSSIYNTDTNAALQKAALSKSSSSSALDYLSTLGKMFNFTYKLK
jgi:hypothetical protein